MAFVSTRARLIAARLLCLVALAAIVPACATGPKRPPVGAEEPDKFLFDHGTEALNARRWLVAREFFRQLMDSYPQSPYRADAKLGIGDSFLGEGSAESQVMAINEYREFLSFYPTHDRAHYAQFKLGMAHFYEMRGPARDQSETKEAIRELTAFVERYPGSPLIARALMRPAWTAAVQFAWLVSTRRTGIPYGWAARASSRPRRLAPEMMRPLPA